MMTPQIHFVHAARFTRLLCTIAMLCTIATAFAADNPLPNRSPHTTIGTVNCTNSTCHGSTTAWDDSNVLQNEYTTWLRLDKHAKAYAVLLNEQSRSIAKKLGLKEGAHEAKICLDCHAHNPKPELRGERHIVSEGVSCEGCHGPADKYVRTHTVANTSHADNIANGLYPTDRPVAQAKLCLSCHAGDETRYVTHRIMGAGHPRISFELDTFAQLAPAHYKIDDDWRQRKGEFDNVRMWAISQAVASQHLLNTLADPKRGRDGLFPELALFDCHACHHPMSEKKWTPRLGVGPGRMRLNDSNLLMLRAIVRATDSANADAFSAQVTLLHQAISGNAEAKGADPLQLATKLSATIDQQIAKLEKQKFDTGTQRALLAGLLDEARRNEFTDYAGAEQAYLSITSLVSSLVKQGALRAGDQVNRLNKHLGNLRKLLANEDKFKPDSYAAELQAMRGDLRADVTNTAATSLVANKKP